MLAKETKRNEMKMLHLAYWSNYYRYVCMLFMKNEKITNISVANVHKWHENGKEIFGWIIEKREQYWKLFRHRFYCEWRAYTETVRILLNMSPNWIWNWIHSLVFNHCWAIQPNSNQLIDSIWSKIAQQEREREKIRKSWSNQKQSNSYYNE